MSKWIAKLFEPKHNSNDIVRFIRTEYFEDVKHLTDDDVIMGSYCRVYIITLVAT